MVRNEALEKVSTDLREAQFVTASIGELGATLAARCTDSNKNLAAESLRICSALGTVLGPHCRAHLRTVVPGLLAALGDSKANIRQAALAALGTWLEQTSLKEFCDGEMFADALNKGTPNTKAELFGWLATQMKKVSGQLPKDDLVACLPHLYASLEDRNADVRKGAGEAVLPFMIHLEYDAMARHAGKLKPASKTSVIAVLDRERQNLPAKAPPKPHAAAGNAVRPAASCAQSTESLDEEPPSPPTAEAAEGGKTNLRAISKTPTVTPMKSIWLTWPEERSRIPPLPPLRKVLAGASQRYLYQMYREHLC